MDRPDSVGLDRWKFVERVNDRHLKKLQAPEPADGGPSPLVGGFREEAVRKPDAGKDKPATVQLDKRRERSPCGDRHIQPFGRNAIVIHSSNHPLALYVVTPLALALAAVSAQAAETRVDLQSRTWPRSTAQYLAANASMATGDAEPAGLRHAEMLSLDADSSLTCHRPRRLRRRPHYRYQQTFRGMPIFGEHVIVSEGKQRQRPQPVRPRGQRPGRANCRRRRRSWPRRRPCRSPRPTPWAATRRAMRTEREDARQMIYIDDANRAHMAYVVSFFADSVKGGSPTRPFVIVDAQQRQGPQEVGRPDHALVGTGPGGNTKTGQYEWGSGGRYGFLDVTQSGTTCTMNNANVKSVNLNGGTHQHHGVLLHLPAQHLQDHQWRLLADQRRALLRRRDHPDVPGLHRLQRAELPAGHARALQHQLRERVLGRRDDELRRRRQHVLSAGRASTSPATRSRTASPSSTPT